MANFNKKDNLIYLFLFIVVLLVIFLFDNGFLGNKDSKNIFITNNNTEMICSEDIKIYKASSTSDLLKKYTYDYTNYQGRGRFLDLLNKIPLDSLICSANYYFDGSEDDKKALMYLVHRKIPLTGKHSRKDITSYFFYKLSQ